MKPSKCLLLLFVSLFSFVNYAAVKLPSLISNNMVLQQKSNVALWGWAQPGEKLFITTSWNNKTIDVSDTQKNVLVKK